MESLGDILRRMTPRNTSGDGADRTPGGNDNEADPQCPICKGRGWVTLNVPLEDPNFGKAQPCRCLLDTSREDRRERFKRYSNLGMLSRYTFDTLKAPDGTTEVRSRFMEAAEAAKAYVQDPKGWFILAGASASGKTPIAAAIAGAFLEQGRASYFMTVPDLLDHLRATFGPNSEVEYDDLFEQIRNVPLLVLDDLGTQSATPWAREKLYQLFNHRYHEELPTVVTLACMPDDLEERLRTRLLDSRMSQVHYLVGAIETTPSFQQIGVLPEEMLSRMTFRQFDVRGAAGTDQTGRQTLDAAFRFAQNFAKHPQGWVVFTGVPGCGKTHLAVAIAGERLKEGSSVFFVMVPELMDHLRRTFSPGSVIPYDQLFEQVKNAPLLILDDMGAELGTPWVQEKLYQIIAHRYNLRLPTVITTSVARLEDLPPAIASRLGDGSLVDIQPIAAPDYRSKETGRYRSTRKTPRSRERS